MRHSTCRRAVLAGEGGAVLAGEGGAHVEQHLASCAECAAYAARVRDIVSVAPSLAGEPAAPDLADRVIQSVRTGAPAGALVSISRLRRAPGRPVLMAGLSAAAAVALVAGLVATRGARGPGGENHPLLVSAAQATSEIRTARLTFEGEASGTMRVPLPSLPAFSPPPLPSLPPLPTPDLSQFPPEMRERAQEQFEEAQRRYEEQRKEAEGRLAQLPQPSFVPPDLSFSVAIEGSGEVALPDRLHMRGTMRAVSAGPFTPPGGEYEVVVVGGRSWVRVAGGGWLETPGPGFGPFGPLVLDPNAVPTFMREGSGVEDLGEETLDGERVRHIRFRVTQGEHESVSEAWIGVDDHILRKMRMSTKGSFRGPTPVGEVSSEWKSSATIRLHDFGAAVTIEPPSPGEVRGPASAPEGSSFVVYPFGYSYSAGTKVTG